MSMRGLTSSWRLESGLSSGNLLLAAVVSRSDLLYEESVVSGLGMEREGSSGLGGEVEPGLGSRDVSVVSLPESDPPEVDLGE